jgi:stage IV sporulation protein FA
MGNRADDIRKQIAKRNRGRSHPVKRGGTKDTNPSYLLPSDEERYGGERYSSYEMGPPPSDSGHPLFKKETFMMKILGAGILVLFTAIIFKSPAPIFDKAETVVERSMGQEFQFASISSWYEEQFGKPLALLPSSSKEVTDSNLAQEKQEYSVPASIKVVENFKSNGQGIMLETGLNEEVAAMKGGTVIFAGKKDDLGNTVIIQHEDKTESWYGHLESIEVAQYEQIEKGNYVGKVSDNNDVSGEFYFAIKMGGDFIDPIQVIPFE